MATRAIALFCPLFLVVACSGDVTEIGDGTGTDGATSGGSTTTLGTDTTAGVTDTEGSMSNSMGSSDTSNNTSGVTETADTTAAESSSDTSSGTTDTGGGIPCDDNAGCDDLLPCNGVETCDMGSCAAGTAVVCDDEVPCTLDVCNDIDGGTCVVAPDDTACADGLFCNGAESCDLVAGCQPGEPIVCTDGIGCTDDACDEDADACNFALDDGGCDDGTFCNGAEACDPVQGCIDGQPIDCNDFITCTTDTCDENAGACAYATDDQACDNAVFCDGEESCEVGMGCVPGPAVSCGSDGVACTDDQCNEDLDDCESAPDNGACAPAEFCTDGGCIAGAACFIANGVLGNPICDDGLGCNGAEVCFDLPGPIDQCQPGTAIACGDGFACTSDSCAEPGNCVNTPNDGVCSDADPCNGTESCSPALGCVDGLALDCDDDVDCTLDQCVSGFGCNNIEADGNCEDGVFCNGAEVCDGQLGCLPSAPVVCPSDGIACTAEVCNEVLDTCSVIPNDDLCACGQECNPNAGGCDATCSPAECDGHVYQCGNCLDDDGDCDIDDDDSNCFGPCSDNEAGLAGLIPGQNSAPCKHDCYFDNDTGAGNDDCFWSHECDPLEPSATTCEYDPDANVPGTQDSCAELEQMQSADCDEVCGPLTPNGCDCFGCCTVDLPGIGLTEIFLGSAIDGDGDATCSTEVFDDANVLDLCHPCTQVPACLNPCDPCEICFGETELPPGCVEQDCGQGGIPCGIPGQAPCPNGGFCLTGCCVEG